MCFLTWRCNSEVLVIAKRAIKRLELLSSTVWLLLLRVLLFHCHALGQNLN